MTPAVLIWGVLFSSIGFAYFIYGRKQRAIAPLVCGIALMVYPYFMPNAIALVIVGCILVAVPYFLRL